MNFFTQQGRALLLAAAVMFAAAMPAAVYAQLGALGNMAKGKALEALNNKVMEGLEKKFAETVAKESISEEAKAAVVKKLSEIARPIVKRFIDGAASGKPPNPAELVNTVMKDILPRVPEIVAASKTEGGGGAAVAAQGGQAQPAQQTQEKPKIAAYVSGAEIPEINKAMTARLSAALSNSGRYMAIDGYKDFFLQVAGDPNIDAASLNSEPIRVLGKSFGAEYVCVAEITSIMGENQISARIINVESGTATAVAVVESPLKALADVADACERIVAEMFKNAPPLVVAAPAPPPVYAPPPPPVESQSAGQQAAESGGEAVQPRGGVDWYITPKYLMVPLSQATSHGFDIEFGVVWGKGLFIGVEGGLTGGDNGGAAGFSLNIGNTYDITPGLQVTYGTFVGYWFYEARVNNVVYNDYLDRYEYTLRDYPLGYIGPSVRFRFGRIIEVTYRGFIGGEGYGNQVMLGFYFATSNRNKPPKR